MLNVQLDEDVAKDMLYEELNKWNIDGTERELLYDYFDECVDSGFFDGGEFNPAEFVDNLYVNYSSFAYEGDDDWEKLGIGTEHQDESVQAVKDGVALVLY